MMLLFQINLSSARTCVTWSSIAIGLSIRWMNVEHVGCCHFNVVHLEKTRRTKEFQLEIVSVLFYSW